MSGLGGRTVAILEARRSAELAKLIQQRGAEVYIAPALREEPLDDDPDIARFIDELCAGAFDLALFLTGVGVRTLFAIAERLGRRDQLLADLGRLPIFCRGPKPVAALRTVGLEPAFTTPSPFTTQQILERARGIGVAGKRIGVVLHGGPSPELVDGLRGLGAEVRAVRVYRWALPEDARPIEGLIERLQAGAIDAIAFTSASQIENLFALADAHDEGELLLGLLNQVRPIVAVGPVCAAALHDHGLRVDVQPAEPKMGPMVLALDRFFAAPATQATAGRE